MSATSEELIQQVNQVCPPLPITLVSANDIPVSEASKEIPDAEEIRHLEAANKELMNSLDESLELGLHEVPDDPFGKLQALKCNNEILTEALNAPEALPSKPKFGKTDGPIISVHVKSKPEPIWIDKDGVNVDTGERVQLPPSVIEKLDQEGARRAAEWLEKSDAPVEQYKHYAMTKEEFDLENEKEYPVRPLPKQPGPKWDDSILYGLSGDVIRKAGQYCESHPAGMLVDFLVSIGSIIGRGPYFNIGATKHYTNEFMARVGDSSKSRKGTGRDAVDAILKLVDPGWHSDRIESGFGSGEAIINRVRDTVMEPRRKNGVTVYESVPGVDDKRLCIREGELASIFVLAGKPDSRADIIIRDGWDGKTLRNIVKGKGKDGSSNSAKCEEPHLSISGDTTVSELRMKMPDGADENGFGNRFIYVYVYRVKDCPQGGPEIDWSQEIVDLHQVIQFAKTVKHVSMTVSARRWWNNHYSEFEHQGPDGLAGKMTTRAAAHIRRLAMIYALLDQADEINLDHFYAAKRLWDYCSDSAMFIFGGVTTEQLRIVNWIGQRGSGTYKQIRDELYQRHRSVVEIKADLDVLVKQRKLRLDGENYVKMGN
ncbi:MAG: hypothetical protein JWO71_2479 [Candidatus Acidoferrum typicum]|nr:hypothetical protein [Candidatus Acidoferrum typicum]